MVSVVIERRGSAGKAATILSHCLLSLILLLLSAGPSQGSTIKSAGKNIGKLFRLVPSEALTRAAGVKAGKVLEDTSRIAKKYGVKQSEVEDFIVANAKTLRKAEFDSDALEFAWRNQDAGLYMIDRFYLPIEPGMPAIKGTKLMNSSSDSVVKAAHDCAVNGKGWGKLADEMTNCNLVGGTDRDFCESLFLQQAKAGKIEGISKEAAKGLFPAKRNERSRDGFDFLLCEPGKPLRIIEFGTGRKPGTPRPGKSLAESQGTRENAFKLLDGYMDFQPNRINLRDKGMSKELIDFMAENGTYAGKNKFVPSGGSFFPKRGGGAVPSSRKGFPDLPAEKWQEFDRLVSREFFANSINSKQINEMGAIGYVLP